MKVSYVNGVCVNHDAISNSVRDEVKLLLQHANHDVRLFGYACDFPEIPFTRVENVADIALDPHFQSSDLVVFHFGVYYPLFDLLPAVPAKARRLVVFHNITPKEVLPRNQWPTIERSNAQLANVVWADHVVCVSHTNLQTLKDASITTPASVLPLPVRADKGPETKPSFRDWMTRMVFLGRFVRSKGPQDFLAALQAVMAAQPSRQSVHVDMIGNLLFSDHELLDLLRAGARELQQCYPGQLTISFHGNVEEEAKQDILRNADVFVLPTYHEGFCVPIIEALAAGCRVVTYENSNTPAISGGLATLTCTGDVPMLASALRGVMDDVTSEKWRHGGYTHHLNSAWSHVRKFEPAGISNRFLRLIETFAPSR